VLKSDSSNASDITTWQINDGKVMAAMVNSTKQSMIMSLRKFKIAKQIWSALKQRYVQDSGALLHNLMQQIHVIEQGDMSIDDYYSAYDRLMGSLTSMVNECTAADCPAHKFLDRFLTYRFVMRVKPEFDSIRTQLLHNSSTLTMDQALAALLAEEKRLQSLSSFSPVTTPHNVLAASQRITVPRGTSSEPCKHCGKTTHLSANCFRAYPEKLAEYHARRSSRAARGRGTNSNTRDGYVSIAATTRDGSVSIAVAPSVNASQPAWVLDSGASSHVTSDQFQLVTCKPVTDPTSIQTADGTHCYITHWAPLYTTNFSVPDISFVPQLSMNLLSVGQIADHNCFIGFDDSSCFIQDRQSGAVIGTGHCRRGTSNLYVLDTLRLPSSVARVLSVSSSSPSSFVKWHHRLGHLSGSRLSTLIHQGYLGHTSVESNFHCKDCKLGKQIQLHYPSSVSHSTKPFDLIHSDVWGPAPFATKGGHNYYVIFVNDYSRYTWLYFMKHRSRLCSIYKSFTHMVHTQFSTPINFFVLILVGNICLIFFASF
jgi:hypothetical protein